MDTDRPMMINKCEAFDDQFMYWFHNVYKGFDYASFLKLGFNMQVGVILQFFDSVGLIVEIYRHYDSQMKWRISIHEDEPLGEIAMSELENYFGKMFHRYQVSFTKQPDLIEFHKRNEAMYIAIHYAMKDYTDYIDQIQLNKERENEKSNLF